MNFEECIEIILDHEGGYVNNPKDPGGETKFGISKRAYPKLNISGLTRNQAITIYKNDYWDKYKISEIDESCRLMYFDCCVNQGYGTAKSLFNLAKSLYSKEKLLGAFAKLRLDKYQALSSYQSFSKGWGDRVLDITIKSFEALLNKGSL